MNSINKKGLKFVNIILGCITTVLILSIAYLTYKSWSHQTPLNYKLIILCAAGLFISIFTFFICDSWKRNITVFMLSTFIAVYCLELVLFVQFKHRFPQTNIDSRNKLEILEDLRAQGIDAWPHVIPYLFVESNGLVTEGGRTFPLGGISKKTIVYCNESGQYGIFKSDEYGFNNPEGLHSKNKITSVLIGDSFTLGNCVQTGEDIAGQLRNMGVSSLNLGNGGNGPLIELAELSEYVKPLQPKIVLWLYFEGNDLFELEEERNSPILMGYLNDSYLQNLSNRQDEIDEALMKYVRQQWLKNTDKPQIQNRIVNQAYLKQQMEAREAKGKLLKLWHLRKRIGLLSMPGQKVPDSKRVTNNRKQLPLFANILSTAHKRVTSWSGKLYFVYLPDMERYVNDSLGEKFFDRNDVVAIVHNNEIPLIDFHEVLKEHPEPLSLSPFLGAHYNSDGYKLLAEQIYNRLKKDHLINSDL